MPAYALTIFMGAFLLFQVQPLIGKYILPWFGGGPGVWTTCMLFFQVLLLAGYAYAYFTSRWLRPRRQVIVHLILLLSALVLLPITPSDSWKPHGGENPTLQILTILAACIGLPYFVLSTTGPLMQQWFSRTHPGVSPYRLFALSNAGSLIALVSFPFYFESHFTRKSQAFFWGCGLIAYVAAAAYCAMKMWKASRSLAMPNRSAVASSQPVVQSEGAADEHPAGSELYSSRAPAASSTLQKALWLLLAACASSLLLAVTNKLCQDVAVIPFLWVLPLALYLLSFIICFDNPRWYLRFPFILALTAAMGGICWVLFKGTDASLMKQVTIYSAGLFICCMVCHGELYRLKPDPRYLTSFYLLIAAGGALGGLFVAVAAPLLFTDYYELHWGLLLCGLLLLVVCVRDPGGCSILPDRAGGADYWHPITVTWLVLGMLTLSLALWTQAHKSDSEIVHTSRNFYGVLTVYEHQKTDPAGHHFLLQHGRITHGLQFVDPQQAAWPTTYYGAASGIDRAVRALTNSSRRIGVVGLGTGTIAAFGQKDDYLRIYEINPQVQQLANSRFTYLSNCPAKVELALGDARLSMEREPAQQFDLLALDAFSSDAIPVHLLTKEAFDTYEKHLKTNGIIAVHISNHYLDLEPVVVNVAHHFNYRLAMIDYDEDEAEDEWWLYSSTWMLLSHSQDVIGCPVISAAAMSVTTNSAKVPFWTDDFASLFQILKK